MGIIKKIFPLVFIIIFIGVFSYFEGESFFKHVDKQEKIEQGELQIAQKLEDFSVDDIRELQNTEFYYTPYKKLLDIIVSKINSAEKHVYIEVYMLTETRIKESLVKAQKRGVDVKVVLEHSPYKAVTLNKKHFSQLEAAGVDIVWSNPKNFALNHAKIMLIDEEAILSTGNFTYSTFAYNRDLFIITEDISVTTTLKQIFLDDYNGVKSTEYDHQLIVSPDYSRIKFNSLINSAEGSIDIYAQYLKDSKLLNLIYKKAKEGIQVRIVLSKNGYEQYIDELEGNIIPENVTIRPIQSKDKMHSKAFLIDEKYLFIGSINFSLSSMDKNREFGILLKSKDIITKFSEIFTKDFELH